MQKPTSICIFGDSTAWGASDMEMGGWVNRLWLETAKRTGGECLIYNLSLPGGTTSAILERFESEAQTREADAFIFQSGGNDSCLISRNGENNVSVEQFENNVREIITRAQKITGNIIFIGFTNVDEQKTAPILWEDIYYTNSEIKKYNNFTKNICSEFNVPYLNVFGILEPKDLDDGLHPNTLGHEKIFKQVKTFLINQNWI